MPPRVRGQNPAGAMMQACSGLSWYLCCFFFSSNSGQLSTLNVNIGLKE